MLTLKTQLVQFVWRFLALVALLLSNSGVLQAQEAPANWAAVHPALLQQAERSRDPVSFLVILEEQPAPETFLARRGLRTAGRVEKGKALYAYLTDFARRSQAPLWQWLDAHDVAYRPFYIVNAIEVSGDAALITALRQRPEVTRLAANPRVALQLPDPPAAPRTLPLPEIPYGIAYTKAPQVWSMGYRGQGIVVAGQDTGVDWEHPALKQKYRGWNKATGAASHAYNWYDYWGTANRAGCDPDPQVPCDDHGHGTHTVGTLVGSEETAGGGIIVGMAPDAQWIACRNMKGGDGTPTSYMACFEFFLAPYPQGGDPFTDGDPALAPDLINNSWYCPPPEGCDFDSLREVVRAVEAAGQLVVVSAGNQGPDCATVEHPISAYPEVFSVGAHDSSGNIAGFSSRGPVIADGSGRLKPEITAPGVNIYSTRNRGGYTSLSGTSMASPHVAGAVALLWSAAPDLIGRLDETEQILMKSATPVTYTHVVDWYHTDLGNLICIAGPAPAVPNTTYGYGRLNAAAAVEMALHPASLTVAVENASAARVLGAQVVLADELTGYLYEGQTDAAGEFSLPRVYPGAYILHVEWMGQSQQRAVTIQPDEAQTLSVELHPALYLPFIWAN